MGLAEGSVSYQFVGVLQSHREKKTKVKLSIRECNLVPSGTSVNLQFQSRWSFLHLDSVCFLPVSSGK